MTTDEFLQNDGFLTKELLSLAFASSGISAFRVQPGSRQVELTSALKQLLGLADDQPLDYQTLSGLLHPTDGHAARAELTAAIAPGGGECEAEFRIVTPSGDTKWLAVRGRAFFHNGRDREATLFIGTVRDITARKQADAILQEAVEHHEILLHEVNHRVKNSLQLVSSLLRLQARRIADPRMRRLLEDAMARILAIAHVHQRLYRDKDIKRINFGAFVSELCADLQGTSPHCSLKVSAPAFYVTTDRAIPLGLLINELVTNAFKYAYPGGSGPVFVSIEPGTADVTITVSDNGVGLPDGFSIENADSLGMVLITGMVSQLSGRLEVLPRQQGATFVITAAVEDAG